jgi:hypothetical protein
MADTKDGKEPKARKETEAAATQSGQASSGRRALGIRLVPVDNSDQPVFANFCNINVAPGVAFVDFGFLEPGMVTALPRVARSGGKLPESVNGKLAVRVALGYQARANQHHHIGQGLTRLRQARPTATGKDSQA